MSDTLVTSEPAVDSSAKGDAVPPLRDGDRLHREEFHRRYEAMGPGTRAELIEGVVYLHHDGRGNGSESGMASPVSLSGHGMPHLNASFWVGAYCARTPGLLYGNDSSVLLDNTNEPQPDILLGIPEVAGGATRTRLVNGKTYLDGAPELVIEVAASTARTDLNQKLTAYARNGVREYIVLLTDREPSEVRWFDLAAGPDPKQVPVDRDGLHKSVVFPGLWLDPAALLAGDLPKLLAAVEQGTATSEHAAFAQRVRPAS